MKKSGESLMDLLNTMKQVNMGVPEKEKRKKGAESLFEDILPENSPSLRK